MRGQPQTLCARWRGAGFVSAVRRGLLGRGARAQIEIVMRGRNANVLETECLC